MTRFAIRPVGLFALAAVTRLAYLFVAPPPFQDFYWDLASNLLRHGSLAVDGVKTTDFEPLYPLFLAAARWIARDNVLAVQVMQALVASFGAVCLAWLAEALSGQRRVGVLAGVLFACYPLLIRHSVDGVEAALLTTLLIGFAYAFVVARTASGAGVAGLWLGAAVLTRAAVLPLLPLGIAVMVVDGRRRAAIGLTLAAVVIAPYAIRNHGLNGSLLPTRSGRNLFIANSEYVVVPEYGPDILEGFAQEILARNGLNRGPVSPALEREQDLLLGRYAIAAMKRRPISTLQLKAKNILYFFSPRLVPYRELTPETRITLGGNGAFSVANSPQRTPLDQWAYTAPYMFVVVTALVGVYARRPVYGRDAILWCIVLTFVAVHTVYFPAARYRAPMEFVLLFYAAVGLDALGRFRRQTVAVTEISELASTRRQTRELYSAPPVCSVVKAGGMRAARKDGAAFVDLSTRLLGEGRCVRFRGEGISMWPTICDGDRLTVMPVDPNRLRPGDIILFEQQRRPIVHRVKAIHTTGDGRRLLITRGDGKAADDAAIDLGQVLGKIGAIERDRISLCRRWLGAITSALVTR